MEDSVSSVRRRADRGFYSCNIWFILIEISFPVQWCTFKWILNPWMLLIAYTLFIIYARVGLTPLYSMLVLFADCWESKLLTQVRLENLNRDLPQPSGIRYVSRSFSVRCLVSLAYGKGLISMVTLFVVVPQAIQIFLCNTHHILSLTMAAKRTWSQKKLSRDWSFRQHHTHNLTTSVG